jgi:hypothetical protein
MTVDGVYLRIAGTLKVIALTLNTNLIFAKDLRVYYDILRPPVLLKSSIQRTYTLARTTRHRNQG